MYGKTGALNPMYGRTHTPETRAKMSEAHIGLQSGENNPMYGKTHTPETKAQMSDSKSGANHPMYGKVAANAMTINVYSLNGKLINSFPSQVAAANWLGVSNVNVHKYIKSGKVWNHLYTFRKVLRLL
jgi:group I intron endonuclease